MWAAFLHLVVGNFLIGLVEAWILCRWFEAKWQRAYVWMVVANYVSAFVGLVFFVPHVARWFQIDLYNVWRVHLLLYGLAYLATLVLEWPAVFVSLPAQIGRLKRSVVANVMVQTVTNALVLLWYTMATTTPQSQGWTFIPPDRLSLTPGVVVYYIGEKDGDVCRMTGADRPGMKVMVLGSKDWRDRLCFAPEDGANEVVLRSSSGKQIHQVKLPIEMTTIGSRSDSERMEDNWMSFGAVPKLGRRDEEATAFMEFWADKGLDVQGVGTFAVNLPFAQWIVRNAVELPDGRILLQLGENQICLLDPKRKTAGVLVRGRGPAVALDHVQANGDQSSQR